MKINELKPKTGNVELIATVISVEQSRKFDKDGKKGKVAKAVIKDETGECKLTLWNEQTDEIKHGQRIKITNAWADEFKGELQVSTGKYGKIEVLERDETLKEAVEPKKEEKDDFPDSKRALEKKEEYEDIYSEDDEIVFDADDDDII
jgi:replication factor A1